MSSKVLESALINMLTRDKDYYLYAYIVSQCRVTETKSIETLGVSFSDGIYNLAINTEFFDSCSLEQAKGVLKHEVLHIMYKHIFREPEQDYHKYAWNYSCDMAINQQINSKHLQEGAILPVLHNLPEDLNAEQYYFLLKEEHEKEKQNGNNSSDSDYNSNSNSDSNTSSDNNTKNSSNKKVQNPFNVDENSTKTGDVHNWDSSKKYNEELVNDITSRIIDKAIEQTQKSKGNVPCNIGSVIELFNKKAVVNWKAELRKITGNKKSNQRTSIKRRSRRFNTRLDIPGKIKDYTFDTLVVVDVSGSVSDAEILSGLVEINEVLKHTQSTLKIIQVDSKAYPSEDFDKNKKEFRRKASGGTTLYPAIEQAASEKLHYDLLIVISDMEIFDKDIESFNNLNKRQIWLSTNGNILSEFGDRIKQFNIKDFK